MKNELLDENKRLKEANEDFEARNIDLEKENEHLNDEL